jgi:hypothetical protein
MCKSSLADQFPDAKDALRKLLDKKIPDQLMRLDQIFNLVECAWKRNIKRLQDKPVQYLLVAEAAPWTETGIPPRYFYESLEGQWVGRILRTFFSASECRPEPNETRSEFTERVLLKLADKGFLLIDTLPFALRYTTQVRMGKNYLELLQASKAYFYTQLNDPGLKWANNTKIALAFRWNGIRVIEAYGKPFSESLIAADRSGFTNTRCLRVIWGLPDPPLSTI